MTDKQIKHMVNRFLAWRLPENFTPDAGISFKAAFNEHTTYPMKHQPLGTNLFDADQAEGMVRHMIEGVPMEAVHRLESRAQQAEQEAERLRATVTYIAAWKLYDEDQRQKTDDMAGAYETAITLCRAALAPQSTEAQEETAEDIKRSKIMAQINKVREKLLPHPDTERLDWLELRGGIGAVVWKGLSELGWLIMGQRTTYATLREAIDAARKEAGDKPGNKKVPRRGHPIDSNSLQSY